MFLFVVCWWSKSIRICYLLKISFVFVLLFFFKNHTWKPHVVSGVWWHLHITPWRWWIMLHHTVRKPLIVSFFFSCSVTLNHRKRIMLVNVQQWRCVGQSNQNENKQKTFRQMNEWTVPSNFQHIYKSADCHISIWGMFMRLEQHKTSIFLL